MKPSALLLSASLLLFGSNAALSAEYYVSPNGDNSNPGSLDKPWKTIGEANANLKAGDTAYLRGGNYDGQTIKPANSGTSGNPIIYKAYGNETPVIRRVSTGLSLTGKGHITIEGIDMDGEHLRTGGGWPGINKGSSNIQNFARIEDSHHITIQNVFWKYAHGWAGIKIQGDSHHNKILNNSFDFVGTYDNGAGDDPGDILQIGQGSENNLVEGNTFKHGGHNLIEMTGRYNVIRNNIFDNDWSDVMGGNKGNRALTLKGEGPQGYTGGYNLFEDNIIVNAKPAIDNPDPPSMKVIGEGQIVRRNFLFDNYRNGMVTSNGGGASNGYVKKNRIYNNVFYNHGGPAWNLSWNDSNGMELDDNVFKNNIVYKVRQNPAKSKLEAEVTFESATDPLRDNKVIANLFFNSSAGDAMVYTKTNGRLPLSDYESLKPNNFSKNVQKAPKFVSTSFSDKDDFKLDTGSPAIDAGDFLTQTRNGGSGKSIPVADPHYFSDGFGVIAGDTIKVGNADPVTITSVDYANKVIGVDKSISWAKGDPVSLNYSGSAPDIGAIETGQTGSEPADSSPPSPPKDLKITP